MKYGESNVARRQADGDNLLRLRDIADRPISITGYEQRRSRYNDGAYLILTVVQSADTEQSTVQVATGATVVMERVRQFFEEHPREIMETVITKRAGREGREYWTLIHPDTFEAQRVENKVVRYPTRGERLVRPLDVAGEDEVAF